MHVHICVHVYVYLYIYTQLYACMIPAVFLPSGLSSHIISEVCGHASDPSGVSTPWIASEVAILTLNPHLESSS